MLLFSAATHSDRCPRLTMDADVNVYGKEIIRIQIGNKYELNRQYILNIFYQRSKNAVPCVLFEHCIYRLIGSESSPNFILTLLFHSSVQYVNPLVTHYFEQRMGRSIAVCVNFFPKKYLILPIFHDLNLLTVCFTSLQSFPSRFRPPFIFRIFSVC